jgi:hypothetical protein
MKPSSTRLINGADGLAQLSRHHGYSPSSEGTAMGLSSVPNRGS